MYNYRQGNANSLVGKKRDRGDNWRNMFSVYQMVKEFYKENNMYEKFLEDVSNFILNPIIKECIEIVKDKSSVGVRGKCKQLLEFCSIPEIQEIKYNFKTNNLFEKCVIWSIQHRKMLFLFGLCNLDYS